MKKYAEIKDGKINNIAVFNDDHPLPDGWLDVTDISAGVGWTVEDNVPVEPEPEVVELTDEEIATRAKLVGVKFEGVMCSATAEDMWGLAAVKDWVLAGNDINFTFDNGNTLTLTSKNVAEFEAIWIPFRASFF